jgi:hypothetical protein
MTYLELVKEAATMLTDSMQGDPRRMTRAEIQAGCKRFTDRWTAIATDAIQEALDRLYAKEQTT